jgi:hypothetical protein
MKIGLLIFTTLASLYLQAQTTELEKIEKAWKKLLEEDRPAARQQMLHSFEGQIGAVVHLKDEVDLSSLEYFSDLRSSDSSLRVVSYFIPLDNGEYILRGHISKMFTEEEAGHNMGTLSAFGNNAISQYDEDSVYCFCRNNVPRTWYYDLIETEDRFGNMQYTLLGWTPINRLVHRKVVEALDFTRENEQIPKIEYGKPIFEIKGKRQHRLIYDYSAQTTMKLQFNEQQDRIVMDHLSPSEPQFEGIYEYYGPDLSFDAFKWEGDRWVYQADIDVEEGVKKSKKDFEKADKILKQDKMYDSN